MGAVLKTVIIGATGRMGKTLIRNIAEESVPGLALHGAVDLWDSPDLNRDAGLSAGTDELGIPVTADLAAVAETSDVLIDFSFHTGAAGNVTRIAEWGRPVVIGTTGFTDEEKQTVYRAAEKIPVVLAPNTSLGINLLWSLVKQTSEALAGRGYDIEIVERHHRRKKDAPSGTALNLGEAAAEGAGWNLKDVARHGRSGMAEEDRAEQEIGFHAVRGGDFVGEHSVIFAAEGESVELSHRASSRDTFARGALRAAVWLAGQPAGCYSMRDVLGV